MENMSRMEVMNNGFMELSSLSKEAMASLKSPKRRRRKKKVTAWCGPQSWDHTSPTFWDHSISQIQIQKKWIGAYLPCSHWASIGLIFNELTLYGPSNHTRPNISQPWPHTRPFTFSPKHFILGRLLLPEASSNKKKIEHTSKVIVSITPKGANHLTAKHAEEAQVPWDTRSVKNSHKQQERRKKLITQASLSRSTRSLAESRREPSDCFIKGEALLGEEEISSNYRGSPVPQPLVQPLHFSYSMPLKEKRTVNSMHPKFLNG